MKCVSCGCKQFKPKGVWKGLLWFACVDCGGNWYESYEDFTSFD